MCLGRLEGGGGGGMGEIVHVHDWGRGRTSKSCLRHFAGGGGKRGGRGMEK